MSEHLVRSFYRDSMRVGAFLLVGLTLAAPIFVLRQAWTLADVVAAALTTALFIASVEVSNHRYFAHRTFKTHRITQFFMGLGSVLTFQRSPLWWASTHRRHHAHADAEEDCHAPRHGFVHAYWRWIYHSPCADIDPKLVKDLRAFPELVALDRLHPLINAAYVFGLWSVFGFESVVVFFVVPVVITSHVIFGTNYFCHLDGFGYRSHRTGDHSRNSVIFALLAAGQGWHNNHHKFPSYARAGLEPGELDWGYLIICGLEALGLIWDVRRPRPSRSVSTAPAVPGRMAAARQSSHGSALHRGIE